MLPRHQQIENSRANFTSLNLLNIVESGMCFYANEDNLYYKPRDIKDWYFEWDFREYNPNIYSHGFHQYPAKFIPQIVRKLLRVFTNENSTVLDNFMGSGTTLIECLLLNRKKAIGIELNPYACFMAKVKTTPIYPEKLTKALKTVESEYFNICSFSVHNFYNINFWYKEKQILDLSKLRTIILRLQDEPIRDFFLLCMGEVSRRVSLTNHNGFKLHRDKSKLNKNFNPDVFWHFKNISQRNIMLMQDFYEKTLTSKTEIKIIRGDTKIRHDIDEGSIDFIITSPPYGDSRTTVAYGQFSRLPWQWIESSNDIYKLDENLLGGKKITNEDLEILDCSQTLRVLYNRIKEKDATRAKDVLSFYADLYVSQKHSHFYLKKGKYFVLVTGNRTVKNVFLRTDLIISEMSKILGFKTEKILYRNIINKRMPLQNSPTNVKGELSNTILKENIIFLKKV